MDDQERSAPGRYHSDLRNVIGSSAYGYTLTVWSTASVLTHAYSLPSPPEVFSFFLGGVAGFAVLGTLVFGGLTAEFGGESRRVRLWGSFRFVSVALAVGAA